MTAGRIPSQRRSAKKTGSEEPYKRDAQCGKRVFAVHCSIKSVRQPVGGPNVRKNSIVSVMARMIEPQKGESRMRSAGCAEDTLGRFDKVRYFSGHKRKVCFCSGFSSIFSMTRRNCGMPVWVRPEIQQTGIPHNSCKAFSNFSGVCSMPSGRIPYAGDDGPMRIRSSQKFTTSNT
ncbi:unknown [Clostridium sp. CAG:448]|nr:unknown [Clostridium sp. CAG:448]